MISFRDSKLDNMTWNNTTIQLISRIQEYKGKQTLYSQQSPEVLQALKNVAVIQSTESSNRIEQIYVNTKRLEKIIKEKVDPIDRDEAEIAGYRDVLDLIHSSANYLDFKSSVILQMHKMLMQLSTGTGGDWKKTENSITEKLPNGTVNIRFETVSAWRTPEAMNELNESFKKQIQKGTVSELIVIAAYILDFLCIHPFLDGNGRMARLLTLLAMYHLGYEVGRYISIEKIIEETKEQYYETLHLSSQDWHEGNHNILPWIEYFLSVILKAYQRFETRVGTMTPRGRGWKQKKVITVINHMIADFTVSDIEENCPGIGRPTISKVLNKLSNEGQIECIEKGRNARWIKKVDEINS
jgi:Fic family protein